MRARQKTVSSDTLTMLDHVKELRRRLALCLIVLVVGGAIGYFFYQPILEWLKSPLSGSLYYTSPAGSFNFVIKVASMVGIALVVPVAIYQMIMFVHPALSKAFSKARIYTYTSLSVVLAAAGAAFGFYLILPGALKFFAGFQVQGLSALIGADSYLSFVTNVMITFMIVFQLPLLLVIIDHIKPIDPMRLLKSVKWVILAGLLVSVLVPFAFDVTTSLLIAAPIVVLYCLSIVLIAVRHSVAKRKVVPVVSEKELALDDAIIADFFDHQNDAEPVPAFESFVEPVFANVSRGHAMEFKRAPRASVDELRRAIERDRAQVLADKVARYNAAPLRRMSDIR